ncbi:Uncharacterised protein [Collinsella intestinalis]|nr:Uncharacterised protein [Collinsella intestinalis]
MGYASLVRIYVWIGAIPLAYVLALVFASLMDRRF